MKKLLSILIILLAFGQAMAFPPSPPSSGGSTTVVDALTSTSSTSALSAGQGKILNDGKAPAAVHTYGLESAKPATCTAGQGTYFATNTNGGTLYFCDSTNHWTAFWALGADGTYQWNVLNNTTFTPTASTYGMAFVGGVPKFIINGTKFSPAYSADGSPVTDPASIATAQTLTNKTFTGETYPTYASTGTTDQGTKNINIDGASYGDYLYSPLAGTAGTYTPVITSAPGSGNVRYITLTLGGGTNGITTITWTNVDTIGGTMATAVTATKFSHYACKIPASGHAQCAVIGENKDY
jgi:hypothetical protein